MRIKRIVRATAIGIAVLMTCVGVGVASVESAVAATDPTFGFNLTPSNGTSSGPVIRCTIQTEWPHDSGHVLGSVNVGSYVRCSAPVTKIEHYVDLYYGTAKLSSAVYFSWGRASSEVYASYPTCVPGVYQGKGQAVIYAPAGYYPPVGYIKHDSPLVPVDCR